MCAASSRQTEQEALVQTKPPVSAPTRGACKADTAVRVRISDPDLLLALCDYLSEQGLLAVAATQDTADVLVQTAQSNLDAELLVLAALRRWCREAECFGNGRAGAVGARSSAARD